MNFSHQTQLIDDLQEQSNIRNSRVIRARALLFDMDGTLVDSTANVERAYRWWANLHNLPVEPILAVQSGRPHREVMAQFAGHLDIASESARFNEFEEGDETGMTPIGGAEDFLRIAQRGRWAVVTSAKRALAEMRFRVTKLPVPKIFVTADIVKHGKPDPECFLLAAERLQVPPSECVVFEDSEAGVKAARNAEMPVVGVNSSGKLTGTDLLITTYRDLNVDFDGQGWFTITCKETA
jgi:HAD superfamily hydrolase (TIGR01509 family)